MGSVAQKYPIFFTIFCLYIFGAILAIIMGGFLIDASFFAFTTEETLDALKGQNLTLTHTDKDLEDLKIVQQGCIIIGALGILMSTVFMWNAIDIGILLFTGRSYGRQCCIYDKKLKNEMRSMVGKRYNAK
jgi:hypothetical protein